MAEQKPARFGVKALKGLPADKRGEAPAAVNTKAPERVRMNQEIDPLLTRTQVCVVLGGIARSTLRNWEASGKLPPPVRLSERVIGWRRSTIEVLLEKGQK